MSTFLGPRRVHIVAVGGTAMSAIARLFLQLGHMVSGSDVRDGATLAALRREGVQVSVGHAAENVPPDAAVVVHSTAVRADNPELVAAREFAIPVWRRSDAMAYLVAQRPCAAVISGTHGKTTTTSMVTAILTCAGMHPSFFIGGTPAGAGTNATFDDGDWFVVEGDESDRSVLAYERNAVVVTNIEAEHLEHWDFRFDTLVAGFEEFVDGATTRVLCVDDPVTAKLAAARRRAHVRFRGWRTRAGASITRRAPVAPRSHSWQVARRSPGSACGCAGATWPRTPRVPRRWPTSWACRGRRSSTRSASSPASGAVSSIATPKRRRPLRRLRPHAGGDRGHARGHAKRLGTSDRRVPAAPVLAGSQHWQEYADAFVDADVVVITALDGAFEVPIAGVDAQLVVDAVRAAHPDTPLEYLPDWEAPAEVPWRVARSGDAAVTLGCGTITDVGTLWEAEAGRRGSGRARSTRWPRTGVVAGAALRARRAGGVTHHVARGWANHDGGALRVGRRRRGSRAGARHRHPGAHRRARLEPVAGRRGFPRGGHRARSRLEMLPTRSPSSDGGEIAR